MATAILQSSVRTKILAFCDQYIPLIEADVKRFRLNPLVNKMQKAMRAHFKERSIEVLGRLRMAWTQQQEAVERLTKADYITLAIYDLQDESALMATVFQPYYIEAGDAGATWGLRRLSAILGRTVVYRGATEWIEQNAIQWGEKYASLVSQTTNQAIRDQIALAIKEGEGLEKVMGRISDVYDAATGYRSEMIARTEMGRAYNLSGAMQDARLGIEQFEGCVGCDPTCDQCGPFQDSNPHTLDEIEAFEAEVHPNHVGSVIPIVPEGFVPEEVY